MESGEARMPFYGKLFLFSRAVLRLLSRRYRLVHSERLEQPAVYLCRHSDMHGILLTLLWLPIPVHTWGLHQFGDSELTYRHLRDVTFGARYGWPRWWATATARLASYGLAALYRSARAIPVYRGSAQVIKTFRMSTDALKRGESLLIFPDKDYASTEEPVSELYEGFLRIDRFYHRSTGKHIPFIALHGDRAQRTLTVHEPLRFSDEGDRRAQVSEMLQLLQERLSG